MGRRFTVLDDFFADETKSQYVAGLSYEAEEGSPLAELVDGWISEGKVREGGPISEVTGGDAPVEESDEDEDEDK